MNCYIQGMSSCAVQEIAGISSHNSSEEVMTYFCKQALKQDDCKSGRGYAIKKDKLAEIEGTSKMEENQGMYSEGLGENYIFHGVERDASYPCGRNAASNFAKFITENNLGDVVGGQKVANHRYHPDHKTQVFIWNPDREAVKAWWLKHKPADKTRTKINASIIGESFIVEYVKAEVFKLENPIP